MLKKTLKISAILFLLLVLGILIVAIYNIVKIKINQYGYISESDDDVSYSLTLNVTEKVLSNEEMDSLLIKIFSSSMRLDGFDIAFTFVEDHQLYYLKPVIENRLNYFDTCPNDTIWQAVIKKRENYTDVQDQRMNKVFIDYYRNQVKNWK